MHIILQAQLKEGSHQAMRKLTKYWPVRSPDVPTPQPTINTSAHDLIGVGRVPVNVGNSATVGVQNMFNRHLPVA
jgi:hypothetical protein